MPTNNAPQTIGRDAKGLMTMTKTTTAAAKTVGTFKAVWTLVKNQPQTYIGQTVRVSLGPDDLAAWLEATGIDPKTFTIDGNRPENRTNAKDLERNCPTFEHYDPDLGRVVICGVGKGKTCAGDGGHRSRHIVRLIQKGESGIVDVLFSDRSASMGGFDQTGKRRDSTDELRVMQNNGWEEWGQWQSTTAQLVRLRAKNKSVKGGGKAGETWNGVILTPHQSATQWQDGTFDPLTEIGMTQHGNTMKSLLQIFEAWKISSPTSKAWGNDQYRIFGIIVTAVFDVLGTRVDDESELDSLIDALDENALSIGKTWEAWRSIVQPKADIEQDYPAWLAIIQAVVDGKRMPTLEKDAPIKVSGISDYYKAKEKSNQVNE
jgi:hypothetical protein